MSAVSVLDDIARRVAGCTACDLAATRSTTVPGSGGADARLVLVGEAPGADEDRGGLPFIGRSGSLLLGVLAEETGLTRDEVFITNTVKCRPPANRDPRSSELASCRGFLVEQLAVLSKSAACVVTVGNVATRSVLGTAEGIMTLRGTPVEVPGIAAPVLPTIHPAAALRGGPEVLALLRDDLALVARMLEGAAA